MVVVAVGVFPEKSLMSLWYLMGVAAAVAAVAVVVVVGYPVTRLDRLTWPIQVTFGEEGWLEEEEGLGGRRRWTSLMEVLEHSIGKKVVL